MTLELRETFHLDVRRTGPDGDVVETRLVLQKHRGESRLHVTLKLLGWLLFHTEGLEVERAVDQRYKPDLVASDERGDIVLWVDCGAILVSKLVKLTRKNKRARVEVLKATHKQARSYAKSATAAFRSARYDADGRVTVTGFDPAFVDTLAGHLARRRRIAVLVSAQQLKVTIDDEVALETTIHRHSV